MVAHGARRVSWEGPPLPLPLVTRATLPKVVERGRGRSHLWQVVRIPKLVTKPQQQDHVLRRGGACVVHPWERAVAATSSYRDCGS